MGCTKTALIYLFAILIVACKKEPQHESLVSNFKLKTDYQDLFETMTTSDTINIWANLSICEGVRHEKLVLTKKDDKLKIYLRANQTFGDSTSMVKYIRKKDTLWNFGDFLKRNIPRKKVINEYREYPKLLIVHKNDSIKLHTKGLVDLIRLVKDYDSTMAKLFPNLKIYKPILELEEY